MEITQMLLQPAVEARFTKPGSDVLGFALYSHIRSVGRQVTAVCSARPPANAIRNERKPQRSIMAGPSNEPDQNCEGNPYGRRKHFSLLAKLNLVRAIPRFRLYRYDPGRQWSARSVKLIHASALQ